MVITEKPPIAYNMTLLKTIKLFKEMDIIKEMPRYKKTYRKKRRYKRKKKYKSRQSYGAIYNLQTPSPLGKSFKTTMNYAEPTISLNPTAVALADFVFRANSIYDPSFTGTGHQPLGFDQLMPLYDHYVTIGSSIKTTFVNTSAETIIAGISLTDTSTTLTNDAQVIENGSNKYVVLGPNGSSRDTATVTLNCNPNKFLGRSKPLSDPNLRGTETTSPVEQCYFHVWAGGVTGADPAQIQASTFIKYTSVLIEPKQLALS